tara:strand:+ start:16466 stop:17683 length:1218 start_codon:yes stop_codon:yes gene_type:complete
MTNFQEYPFANLLKDALERMSFTTATEIQEQAIPILLEGSDLIACAQTGSGKTAAFALPMIEKLLQSPKQQGLILSPTRELAQQIADFLRKLLEGDKKMRVALLVGGQDIRKQFRILQNKPRIIVATPGRLIDHLKRNTVQIHKVQQLVLDEGDRMIDMGFAPQLEQILKYLPTERQTSFFTATLDKKVKALAAKYLSNPKYISLNNSLPVASIHQSAIVVKADKKMDLVLDQINERKGSMIIFLKTKHGTDKLKKYLASYNLAVDLIHGDRTQGQRKRAITNFKNGKTRILCATDVAARGLDAPNVEHVLNYDLPMQDEDYVHRIGRTARNGASGESISFVTPRERQAWNRLVKKYDIADAMLDVPVEKGEGFRHKTGQKHKSKKKKAFYGKRKRKTSERRQAR